MPLFLDSVKLDKGSCKVEHIFTCTSLVDRSKHFALRPARYLNAKDKFLYVSQREYGSVSRRDENIKFIGSCDATTCHIVVLVSKFAISTGHFDGSDTEAGLLGMLKQHLELHNSTNMSLVEDKVVMEAHIFGGFEDERNVSIELLESILLILAESSYHVHLMTACVYSVNTRQVNRQNVPIIYGVACQINSSEIFPVNFENKGPCSILRSARIYGGSKETMSIYNGIDTTMNIQPFSYEIFEGAYLIPELTDNQILRYCSTSPHCEPDDFAQTTREALKFLTEHPDPSAIFPDAVPLKFVMNKDGRWIQLQS